MACLNYFEETYTELLGSNDEAIKRLALHLDLYLNESLLDSSRKINVGQSRIACYIANANLQQYENKTYDDYLSECVASVLSDKSPTKDDCEIRADVVWSDGDIENKSYVLQTIGYDCFDDSSYSEENKKFLYNTLADYLSDEVIEDPHKLQSAIAMVKTILQRENIDRLINAHIRQSPVNYALVEQLGKIKGNLTSDINSTAKENAISAKNSGKGAKGSNTLTNITKEMIDNNFDDAKINVVDVKMSNAYQLIAEKNAQALMSELQYQSDDYARLLSEGRAFTEKLQTEITKLEEENRKLRIEIKRGGGS